MLVQQFVLRQQSGTILAYSRTFPKVSLFLYACVQSIAYCSRYNSYFSSRGEVRNPMYVYQEFPNTLNNTGSTCLSIRYTRTMLWGLVFDEHFCICLMLQEFEYTFLINCLRLLNTRWQQQYGSITFSSSKKV